MTTTTIANPAATAALIEAARVSGLRASDYSEVVQDTEGVWHLRDDAGEYIPQRGRFAWFLCGSKDDSDPIHGIDTWALQGDLTIDSDRCDKCWPIAAPEWLLEVR